MIKSSVFRDQDSGTRVGVNQLLIMIAGIPAAIPAISQASASLRRVGTPIQDVEEAHQAYTGIENKIKIIGNAINIERISPKSPPINSKIAIVNLSLIHI